MKRQLTRKQVAFLVALVEKEHKSVQELANYYEEIGRLDRRNKAVIKMVDIDVLRNALSVFRSGAILANEEVFR